MRVPVLNTWSILERVPLSKSKNLAGSAEPVEPILTRPLFRLFTKDLNLLPFLDVYANSAQSNCVDLSESVRTLLTIFHSKLARKK